jgi:hypothetical protein
MEDSQHLSILHDLPGLIGCDKPPKLGAFRPDLYAANAPTTRVIVGEAKTAVDLETSHSRQQLVAFLKHLALYPGSTLVLAVPWSSKVRAKQMLIILSKETDSTQTHLVVIDDVQEIS